MAYKEYSDLSGTQQAVVQDMVGYFRGQGFNDYAIAGICGNCFVESGFDPKKLEIGNFTDGAAATNKTVNQYVTDVNAHIRTKKQFTETDYYGWYWVNGKKYYCRGFGLFQFTSSDKKASVYDVAMHMHVPDIGNVNVQCQAMQSSLNINYRYYPFTYSTNPNVIHTPSVEGNDKFINLAKNSPDKNKMPKYIGIELDSDENWVAFFTSAFEATYEKPADPPASFADRYTMALSIFKEFKNIKTLYTKNVFNPRLEAPQNNPTVGIYWKSPSKGGINRASVIDYNRSSCTNPGACPVDFDVLPNCVGYAHGRFDEIMQTSEASDFCINNPPYIWELTKRAKVKYHGENLDYGSEPEVGALILWEKDEGIPSVFDKHGHIAVVEKVEYDGSGKASRITISESHYKSETWFQTFEISRTEDSTDKSAPWIRWKNWGIFLGFIYHPKFKRGGRYSEGGNASSGVGTFLDLSGITGPVKVFNRVAEYTSETISKEVLSTNIETIDYKGELDRTESTSLLSYPTFVESPYISVTIGNYTFGSYNRGKEYVLQTKAGADAYKTTKSLNRRQKLSDGSELIKDKKSGNVYAITADGRRLLAINNYGSNKSSANAAHTISYPNFLTSLNIVKVNGSLNVYTIGMVYQIRPGDDPNFLDKIFSSISDFRKIKISYGDSASPSFLYKEEEAIITKIDTNVSFSESRITYTLHCTSTAAKVIGNAINWSALSNVKPSEKIMEILQNNKDFGLLSVFPAMTVGNIKKNGWIAGNDRPVKIEAKKGLDPLSYINYLVTCMVSNDSDPSSPLKNSSYYMTIVDDVYNEYGGAHFTIREVKSKTKTIATADTYEVDVGYPGDPDNNKSNLIMSFDINTDNSWAILYNYTEKMSLDNYTYTIDNKGNVVSEYSPAVTTSVRTNSTNASQKSWWTNMTQFPITATLTIKGLMRSTMLMTYLRVNALFYGQRHISSGLYIITKQEDKIDRNGYRTVLSLTRIAGDEDYIKTEKKTITAEIKKAKVSYVEVGNELSDLEISKRLNIVWDDIEAVVKDKTPGSLTKEQTQTLYEEFVDYMDTNAYTGSKDRSVVSLETVGLLLFGTARDDEGKRGFLIDIHKNFGAEYSNTLINKFNLVYNTSAIEHYPHIKDTDYYKAFDSAASEAGSDLVKNGFQASSSRVDKLLDRYFGYLETDYKSYVNSIAKGFKDIEGAKKKFESLCKLAYTLNKDFVDVLAVENPDNPVTSIRDVLSSVTQMIQSTERTKLKNLTDTFTAYAEKLSNTNKTAFKREYGNNFNCTFCEAGGLIEIGADLLGIDIYNLD